MRSFKSAVLFFLLVGAAYAGTPTWQTANSIHFNTSDPRQYIGPIFVNSYTGVGPAAGVWQTVDLTAAPWNVPATAKAVLLNGILIITSGTSAEMIDLGVVFRAPGDTSISCDVPNYIGQTIFQQAGTPGGQRSNMSTIAPVVDGKIEWCWHRTTTGQWPANASYGVNLSVQVWFD